MQNATAAAPVDLAMMLDHLKAHVYSPVYWTKTIETLRDTYGITTVIEAGPGKVLTGLGRRIDRALPTLPVFAPATLSAAIESVNNATA